MVNTVALSGGTENASVRFSYTNSDLESMLPNSNVKRNNFNLRGFAKLNDRLTIDAKATYFIQEAKNRPKIRTSRMSRMDQNLPEWIWIWTGHKGCKTPLTDCLSDRFWQRRT